jgi:guanosine-3',5'-bis(diphosphate) 3'-pyrophosphohydrolase
LRDGAESKEVAGLLVVLRFVAQRHRADRRKGALDTPYVNHPIEVAETLVRVGGIDDPVTVHAALLHDVVEDTDATLDEIEAKFGCEVRSVVAEVSDDKSLPKQERKRLQVLHAPELSLRAKHVKLGDKICNVTDLAHDPPRGWDETRQREYLDWTEQVVAGCRDANPELEARYDEVLAYARSKI